MRADLQNRIEQLSLEIRHYPGPIARCDEHLPALLEERAGLMARLRLLEAGSSCSPANTWINDGGRNAA